MKRFREFLTEDPNQQRLQTDKGEGIVDIESESVREDINALLIRATACSSLTPYIAFYQIVKVLGAFHIHLPYTMLSGERGHKIFDINQFGLKTGMNNDGKVVTADPSEYKLYFEYEMNDRGMFDVYCEIIDGQELDEIQDDIDLEEQTVFEALSSFGRAYRNARQGNQGTFNWRGRSYDSELKSRPVNQSPRAQSSTVPIPKASPVQRDKIEKDVLGPSDPNAKSKTPDAAKRNELDAAVFGTPKPTATSTTTATAGPKSRLAPSNSGPASSVARPQAGPKGTTARGPEVPLPRPAPSPNLAAASKSAEPVVPPIADPEATSSEAPPYKQTGPVQPVSRLSFGARWNPETDKPSNASDDLKAGMASAAEKAREAQSNKESQVAVKEEMLSETDSKFTRMLKQRRG